MPTTDIQTRVEQIALAAESAGHVLEDDSPGGISRVQRWTCTRCGNAVLRYARVVYGSIADNPGATCGGAA